MGLASSFMKMNFSLEDRRLLGVHIVGEGATELIHIGQAGVHRIEAVRFHRFTLSGYAHCQCAG